MYLTTMPNSGFHLRPLEMRDASEMGLKILAEPEIAKTLAHDASSVEKCLKLAEAWCRADAIDSPESNWVKRGYGIWAILAPGSEGHEGPLVGIRGFFLDPALPEGGLEAFVAIARPYWGRRLSSESSRLLLAYLFTNTETKAVYSNIWPLLNLRSEAVQRNLGFELWGRVSVREGYGEEKMRQIHNFELWRLWNAKPAEVEAVVREACIKLGQLSAEGLHSVDEVEKIVISTLESNGNIGVTFDGAVKKFIGKGYDNPAFLTYRMTRHDWLGHSSC